MHAGKRYTLYEFILWTRRDIYKLAIWAAVPTLLYHLFDFTFLSITWVPVALLGTAVSFIIGFKNNASYARLWEARQIYGAIINTSRAFGVMVRDFYPPALSADVKTIFYRHFAWLTALRYQLREPRIWENGDDPANVEYRSFYSIPERESKLEDELKKYLSETELEYVLTKKNRATQIMALQSKHLNALAGAGKVSEFQQSQLQASITAFYDNQGKAERIKNFPYPRNFSSVATILLDIFILLVPFGLLNEFNKLGTGTFLEGHTIWLNIPFALLLTWVFNSLDKVGESSTNPFEGGANDVPISNISRTIEIDMRDMLDEQDLPAPVTAVNSILM
jgi:ion channel-forming bestrophin family protein